MCGFRRLGVLIATLSLLACAGSEELLSGLEVQQAVEIVVALKNSGVTAEMERVSTGREEKYSVTVSRSDRMSAMRVLDEYHLPRKSDETFESLTTGDAFVPNLREIAQLRFDRALSVEVERALAAFDGVVEARAVIRSQLLLDSGKSSSPSASVVIRYTSKSGTQPFSSDEIKNTVAKSVPGLTPEGVNLNTTRVFLSGAPTSDTAAGVDAKGNVVTLARVRPFPFMVPAADQTRVRNILSALLGGFALTGLVIGWALSRLKKPRPATPAAIRTTMIEASIKGAPGEGQLPPRKNISITKGN